MSPTFALSDPVDWESVLRRLPMETLEEIFLAKEEREFDGRDTCKCYCGIAMRVKLAQDAGIPGPLEPEELIAWLQDKYESWTARIHANSITEYLTRAYGGTEYEWHSLFWAASGFSEVHIEDALRKILGKPRMVWDGKRYVEEEVKS